MNVQYAAWTDPGRERSRNEDAFFLDAFNGVFAVFDGMGGGGTGDIAAEIGVAALAEFGNPEFPKQSPFVEPLLAQAIKHVNQSLNDAQGPGSRYSHANFGTTVAAIQTVGELVSIAHVGDSRVYRLNRGVLIRCTEDHSLLNEYVKQHKLTDAEIRESPYRNIITRGCGFKRPVEVDMSSLVPESGDVFLICSDGLHSMIDDGPIKDILEKQLALDDQNLELAAHVLVNAANEAGGKDNITVVLVRVSE